MSNRKTTAEKLEAAKLEKQQAEARIKKLQREQNAEKRKVRDRRIYKRGGLIESLLPETESLSDEQFHALMHMTIANKFGKDKLAEIIAGGEKAVTAPKTAVEKPKGQHQESAKSHAASSKEQNTQAS